MSLVTNHFEAEAEKAIAAGIHEAEAHGGTIDWTTARLIASCLHSGPKTSLERFAATGQLDSDGALVELEFADVHPDQTIWAAALWDYLDQPLLARHDDASAPSHYKRTAS